MKSEQLNELATALCKAQAEMGGAKKDSVNPFFKSKYADLESVWDAIREPLTKNGLSILQPVQGTELVTILIHTSGQWVSSTHPIKAKDDSPQAFGSALSYARRYSLAALIGIYQTDDDAETAQARGNPAPYKIPFGKYKGFTLGEVNIDDLFNYASYIMNKAAEENKPIQGDVAEFIERVQELR